MSEPKRRGPRKTYPLVKNLRMAELDMVRLRALAEHWRCNHSAAVRRMLAEVVAREGLNGRSPARAPAPPEESSQ